ncbi:MAG TPA: AtpZ/AtpI family protein [Candidatus Rubrimentiphilum sp.]|nr:AtpZ/AtpI family protein [Candidatus Rubrimentiphilum sp.]
MKAAVALIAAGSAFAGAAIGGLVLGIWFDHVARTGFYAVVGLFVGMAAGAYAAFRLFVQSSA